MQEEHRQLIDQYKENEKAIERSQKKPLTLQVIMVAIVIGMKVIQTTASLTLNTLATSTVLLLLCLHFWDFYPRRAMYAKTANIVLKGLRLEQESPIAGMSFFKSYLKEFNPLGQLLKMALFDLMLIYFFNVSYIQLLKAINPDALVKLRSITPISTVIIDLFLGWAYYQAIKPLIHTRRELKASGVL